MSVTTSSSKNFISLDDHDASLEEKKETSYQTPLTMNEATAPNSMKESVDDNLDEMEMAELEMFRVAEQAFNRKRAQAHDEVNRLYDEMIEAARHKLEGLTASIVAEVSGE